MRKGILLGAAFILLCMTGRVHAANSLEQGAVGVSIGFGDSVLNNVANPTDAQPRNPIVDISGRYFLQNDLALTAGFGFQVNGGDLDGTYLSFNVGVRKYLKVNDFAPFVGGQFSYITYDAKNTTVKYVDYTAYEFAGLAGAEYFFTKEFSVEGDVGVAFGHASNLGTSTTYMGTRNFGVKANFYF